MGKIKYIHFRNDDIRDSLDSSLIQITNLFLEYNIPITHVVEPANVTKEVREWLLNLKTQYPTLIEIGQHGYDHRLKNNKRPGEFGGNRKYQEQYDDIKKGMNLMDEYFGAKWYPIFTFPYGGANNEAYKALDQLNFAIVNGGYGIDLKRRMLYFVGHLLRKNFMFEKRIPYDLKIKPNTNLFEINVNYGFIKKYLNEESGALLQSLDDLKMYTNRYIKSNLDSIGVLIHHRYHNTDEKIKLVDDYLQWIKSIPNLKFATQETIYNTFK
jgi:hypothetical protein